MLIKAFLPYLRRFYFCLIALGFSVGVQAKTAHVPLSNRYRAEERLPAKRGQKDLSATTKDWNFYVYFAGRNNLWRYVDLNLSQMEKVGSNDRINLIGMVDQFLPDETSDLPEIRYVEVHKGETVTTWSSEEVPLAERMKDPLLYASGSKNNLTTFLEWAIKKYPAKHHCLIFWNHGNGANDPLLKSSRLASGLDTALFTQNSKGLMFNKQPDLLDSLGQQRAVCFNDAYDVYLSNQDLTAALTHVCNKVLHKEFDIVGMDACYMAQLEVACQLEQCCEFLVASEEYELGAGWNYERFLDPVSKKSMSSTELSALIVEAYKEEYASVGEHTLSAINLTMQPDAGDPQPKKGKRNNTSLFKVLEQELNEVGRMLIEALSGPHSKDAIKVLKTIRTKRDYHTNFCENNVDLYHLLFSLEAAVPLIFPGEKTREQRRALSKEISDAMHVIEKIVPHHTAGGAYKGHRVLATRARGMTIYLPKRTVHHSYQSTSFARNGSWCQFIEMFLKKKKAAVFEES